MKKDLDEAAAAGADRYLLKPCEPDALIKVVKELIEKN
jgi:CheY-like chemotaxis protein